MLSFLVKQYIKKRAKASNLTYPKDIEDILGKEIQEYATSKRIVFSWLWDGGGKVPNASATIPGIIFINAEWAARIVLFPDNEDMHNAFRLTMGHEFTHQENDYFFLEPFTKNEKPYFYCLFIKLRKFQRTVLCSYFFSVTPKRVPEIPVSGYYIQFLLYYLLL